MWLTANSINTYYIYIDEIAHMFRLTHPKYVFCDSDSIAEVRKALRTLSLDTDTIVITVDRKVDDYDAVEEMLEPFADEHLFVYVI